QGLLDALDLAS
nr:Chain B, Exoenzyme S [Pseudomonas aeruginosa]6Y7T_D Chain D, Exoenzyme S [Pseudomonas aeruginosa]6Y7T_E Chain E, Exoenzyme S [Pseudomonas aeruginosa]